MGKMIKILQDSRSEPNWEWVQHSPEKILSVNQGFHVLWKFLLHQSQAKPSSSSAHRCPAKARKKHFQTPCKAQSPTTLITPPHPKFLHFQDRAGTGAEIYKLCKHRLSHHCLSLHSWGFYCHTEKISLALSLLDTARQISCFSSSPSESQPVLPQSQEHAQTSTAAQHHSLGWVRLDGNLARQLSNTNSVLFSSSWMPSQDAMGSSASLSLLFCQPWGACHSNMLTWMSDLIWHKQQQSKEATASTAHSWLTNRIWPFHRVIMNTRFRNAL